MARKHNREVHPEETVRYLRPGNRPRQYWWAMPPARSRIETWLNLGAEPILGQRDQRELVEYTKAQLIAGKKVPHPYIGYGEIAVEELYRTKTPISSCGRGRPRAMVRPDPEEVDKYLELGS